MRAIKFRVWDGEKMWFPSHIDFAMSAGKPEPWGVVDWDYVAYHFDEVDVMQYTGLKDRRGRDAYEDDFATGAGKTPDGKRIDFAGRIAITPTKGVVFSMGNTEMAYADVMYFEVIGNIYEHPHLLEKEVA